MLVSDRRDNGGSRPAMQRAVFDQRISLEDVEAVQSEVGSASTRSNLPASREECLIGARPPMDGRPEQA